MAGQLDMNRTKGRLAVGMVIGGLVAGSTTSVAADAWGRGGRMDRSRRDLRRRAFALAVTSSLLAGIALGMAPGVEAAKPCSVKNQDTGVKYGSDLQAAIDAAGSGATLRVNGRCVGRFMLLSDVTLVGSSRRGLPTVTLDANGAYGPGVIVYGASVTLTDLRITGVVGGGPGILNRDATLILNGSTTVTGNTSPLGGGIYNMQGTLVLEDTSSVTGNTATGSGGGIYNEGTPGDNGLSASVYLHGSSTVSGNIAGSDGGGIFNYQGTIDMYDYSTGTQDRKSVV